MDIPKGGRRVAAGIVVSCAAILCSGPLSHSAVAQGNPVITNGVPESESATVQAKITAIDPKTRAITLVGASGHTVTVTAGPIVRLDMLKVGDSVNAKYYRSVAFLVKSPQGGNGTPVTDDELKQVTAQPLQAPGGVGLRMTKVSGTVVGIDMAAHSVDIVNPSGGGVITLDVTDPKRISMLGSLKVGDTIMAVISEALAVSVEPAPKRWF
jgi:hypothetical protein